MRPRELGGAEGTRTHDILLAKQALYQLSYGPSGGLRRPPGIKQRNISRATASPAARAGFLIKEVIQPLVPQRLPCYDFIPVTGPTFVDCPPRGSARRLRVWSAPMM